MKEELEKKFCRSYPDPYASLRRSGLSFWNDGGRFLYKCPGPK